MQHACSTVHSSGCGEHLVRNRRGKDSTWTGCIEHSTSDEAPMHWFMAATTSGNNSYLPLHWGVLTHNNLLLNVYANEVGVGYCHPRQFLFDDILRFID